MAIQLQTPLKPEEVPTLTPQDVDDAVLAIPPYPGGFKGRGITVCAGGFTYFTNAWVLVRMLRMLGNRLPIQFWHYGEEELDAKMRRLVEPFDVECVDAKEVARKVGRRISRGWPLKPLSILYSPFQEVLAIDADNVPIRNPEYLFECGGYRETGAIFWPDVGRTGPTRAIWQLMGVPFRDEAEFETGQIVVNKELCWEPLNLAMWMNEEGRADFIYKIIWGDKDTFRFGWHKFGVPFAMTKAPLQMLTVAGAACYLGVMCQHDLDNERIFQHRNMLKWHLFRPNPWVPGFLFEGECREFLTELRSKWNGRIGKPQSNLGRKASEAAKELIGKVWLLEDLSKKTITPILTQLPVAGAEAAKQPNANSSDPKTAPSPTAPIDPWPLPSQRNLHEIRFCENGSLGAWSNQLLTFWSVREETNGELALLCGGNDGAHSLTTRFRRKPDGSWLGRGLQPGLRSTLRLHPIESVYWSATPNGVPSKAIRRRASAGKNGSRKKLHLFNSAHGIGDHVVALYACIGATKAGFDVVFHTRFPKWLSRVQHPGLTITGDLPPGLPDLSEGPNPPSKLPKGVVDLNHDPAFQSRFGRNRAQWYADAIQPGLKPTLPSNIDRSIRLPRFDFSRYAILAPFSAWARRDWPTANWTRLTHLLREAGFEVVAIGVASDTKRFEEAFTQTTALWAIDHPVEWVMDALLGATCVIGNDSGISHLAGLLGLPTVAIHSHLRGEFLFQPAKVTSVTPKTNCTFCGWQVDKGYSTACDAACSALGTVGPEEVMKFVRKVAGPGEIAARRRIERARRNPALPTPSTSPAPPNIDQAANGSQVSNGSAAESRPTEAPSTARPRPASTTYRGMIAVTIGVGPTWQTVAELAAHRCQKMTGLHTVVLGDEALSRHGLEKPHHLKFRLFDEFPKVDTILYFDADTIFLRPWDVRDHRRTSEFICVPDLSTENVVINESRSIGISPGSYFNSGLFIASRTHHERMFHLAEELSGQLHSTFHDQTYLNAARDRLGLTARYLDRKFNRLRLERATNLDDVVVGHFRWVDSKPKEMLFAYFAYWSAMIEGPGEIEPEAAAAFESLLGTSYNLRRGADGSQKMTFNADKTVAIGDNGTKLFWELSLEGNNRVVWISNDETTLFWARGLIGGGWQGLSPDNQLIELRPPRPSPSPDPRSSEANFDKRTIENFRSKGRTALKSRKATPLPL